MSRSLLVLEEVIAMLQTVGATSRVVERFREQAELALRGKGRANAPDDGTDAITVSSGFGQKSQQGFVELTLNEQLTQMDVAKAREVGLMLLQAAEAATSDAMFIALLGQMGVTDAEVRGRILLELRAIRQGTRDVQWPS
jgi:hypothetical protein